MKTFNITTVEEFNKEYYSTLVPPLSEAGESDRIVIKGLLDQLQSARTDASAREGLIEMIEEYAHGTLPDYGSVENSTDNAVLIDFEDGDVRKATLFGE